MADPHTHTIKKIARKDKQVLLNQLSAALFHLLELLQQRAEYWATGGFVTMVFNTDDYYVYERMSKFFFEYFIFFYL